MVPTLVTACSDSLAKWHSPNMHDRKPCHFFSGIAKSVGSTLRCAPPPPVAEFGEGEPLPWFGDCSLFPFPGFLPRGVRGGVDSGVLRGDGVVSTTRVCEFTQIFGCFS